MSNFCKSQCYYLFNSYYYCSFDVFINTARFDNFDNERNND